jgi:hypothetical protein
MRHFKTTTVTAIITASIPTLANSQTPTYPLELDCTVESPNTKSTKYCMQDICYISAGDQPKLNITITHDGWQFKNRKELYIDTHYNYGPSDAWNGFVAGSPLSIYVQGEVKMIANDTYSYDEAKHDPYGRIIHKTHAICRVITSE